MGKFHWIDKGSLMVYKSDPAVFIRMDTDEKASLSSEQRYFQRAENGSLMRYTLSIFGSEILPPNLDAVFEGAWEAFSAYRSYLDEKELIEKSKGKCIYCENQLEAGAGSKDREKTTEHLIPIFYGGHDGASNTRDCCHECNEDRGSEPLENWLVRLMITGIRKRDTEARRRMEIKIRNVKFWIAYIRARGRALYKFPDMMERYRSAVDPTAAEFQDTTY
jgi:hypothetical protein